MLKKKVGGETVLFPMSMKVLPSIKVNIRVKKIILGGGTVLCPVSMKSLPSGKIKFRVENNSL